MTGQAVFLGTRGEVDLYSRRHRRHSALLILYKGARVMIDCGADWLSKFQPFSPTCIVLTHGHADHAKGLATGALCPVYATAETWGLISKYPLIDRRIMPQRSPLPIEGLIFESFPVDHSLRAPAVGYRVTAGLYKFFYVPDVAQMRDQHKALQGVDLYIGDGATVQRPMLRRKNGTLIGHAPITAQLKWCMKEGISRAIFTHCGSEIVKADGRPLRALIHKLGKACGVDAEIAYDGLQLPLTAAPTTK